MDWLSRPRAKIDCQKQRLSLKGKGGGKMYFQGNNSSKECPIISLMEIKKLVRQRCEAYLFCVTKDRKKEISDQKIFRCVHVRNP